MLAFLAAAAVLLSTAQAQPFQPGQGLAPLGNLRTSDYDGPYNLTLLSAQANEVRAGGAARMYKGGSALRIPLCTSTSVSDKDIIDFLVNVECLEGQFDTYGTFGTGFIGDLALGGPVPVGARQAQLSNRVRMHLMEVALNEQGHALMTRHAGGSNPCPAIDFDAGFNAVFAAAYKLPDGTSVKDKFGSEFDPFKNDVNFVTSMLFLEELGATGNKGLIGIITNPVLANAVAGLATSATAQATIQRMLLWELKDEIVEPFGEPAVQVFAHLSAYRDSMDGEQIHDQGIVNTDPRFIAVPMEGVNMIPTDVRGLTYNRSPMMAINILTIGAKDGKGGFFPEGIHGRINTPEGFDKKADAMEDWPACEKVAVQQSVAQTGEIATPVVSETDLLEVPGMKQLTQALDGVRIGTGPEGRGFQKREDMMNWQREGPHVDVAVNGSKLAKAVGYCGDCDTSSSVSGRKLMDDKVCSAKDAAVKSASTSSSYITTAQEQAQLIMNEANKMADSAGEGAAGLIAAAKQQSQALVDAAYQQAEAADGCAANTASEAVDATAESAPGFVDGVKHKAREVLQAVGI